MCFCTAFRLDAPQTRDQRIRAMTKLLRTTISTATLALFLTGTTSVFACGGEEKKGSDDKNPSAQDSSALCGGEGKKGSDDKNPSTLCGGEEKKGSDDKNPSAQNSSALCGGEEKKGSDDKNPSCGGEEKKGEGDKHPS